MTGTSRINSAGVECGSALRNVSRPRRSSKRARTTLAGPSTRHSCKVPDRRSGGPVVGVADTPPLEEARRLIEIGEGTAPRGGAPRPRPPRRPRWIGRTAESNTYLPVRFADLEAGTVMNPGIDASADDHVGERGTVAPRDVDPPDIVSVRPPIRPRRDAQRSRCEARASWATVAAATRSSEADRSRRPQPLTT